MLRHVIARVGTVVMLLAVLGLATLTTSCGGGSGYAAQDMVLVRFLFVDRALNPTAPTGTQNLPRNAQVLFEFSEVVDPGTVNDQTIQIRFDGQSVPQGSFSVSGNTVRFDPTVTAQGQPNPFGFEPLTQYSVDIPNFEEQESVVRNLDDDPNLVTFFTTFVTSDGYLRELIPPEVLRVFFQPDPDPLTGQIPGNGVMAIEFSEPMDPASFVLGGPAGPDENTAIDVRHLPDRQINKDNGLVVCRTGGDVNSCPPAELLGVAVPGFFTFNPGANIYFFNPTFSFGDNNYVFALQLFQNLRDLSGNLLVNPRSFGPFTSDGNGRQTGLVLSEDFLSTTNVDFLETDADWGFSEEGVLRGAQITSRNAYIFGYQFVDPSAPNTRSGQYGAIVSPLIGAALNNVPNYTPNPATSLGRRVLWAFSDTEMGDDGAVTAAGWGPDSNATFAAIYPTIFLRAGFQKSSSMNLAPSISGNYDGEPVIVYTGSYTVSQAANVGNTPGHPTYPDPANYQQNFGCTAIVPWNGPLFDFTGFVSWPDFTTFFEWDAGDPNIDDDSVFLFDASVDEGDTWQQIRGYFASTFPCSGILQNFPSRRLYTTYEADLPNPPPNFAAGIVNPEPSVTDTCFTVTKRRSTAQTLWYTDGMQPVNSLQQTFGTDSDYLPAQLTPSSQAGGAKVEIEFQGAFAVDIDRRSINLAQPFTPWTTNVNDVDGFPNIRFRISLISNLVSQQVPRLTMVQVPIVQN